MSTISFTETVTKDGQIAVSLFSSDLPAGSLTFSLAMTYSGADVHFNKISYSGSSATSTSASYTGSTGNVSVNGTLVPSSGGPFATLLFDASGAGTFSIDVASIKIAGSSILVVAPVPYSFSIPAATIALSAGSSATGTYQPIDSFFGMSYTVASAPQHGSVVFGNGNSPSTWTYSPSAGFYGNDSFQLKVSDVFDTKQKTISVTVSPTGTSGNDTFHSSAGNYHSDGGVGIDTLTYQGKMTNFTVTQSGSSAVVTDKTGAEGTNYLDNFERLLFSDGAIALDVTGDGGQAYRLYQAAFNRTPDAAGLGYWISALDKGTSLATVADGFISSAEFKSVYGTDPSHNQLITQFYQNILHRQPEQAGLDYWVHVLDTNSASVASVLASISESAENQAGVAAIIGNGFAYKPYGG